MQRELFGIIGALTLGATVVAGCGNGGGDTIPGAGMGGQSPGTGGAGASGGTGGTSATGGMNATGGTGGSTGGSGGSGGALSCNNVTPCGGNVVGEWSVTSSCLKLSGDMDVSLTALGCKTVPVNGSLTTTGTITMNDNGTYTDNTTTTGSVTFPLAPGCLSISMVNVTCADAGNIFPAVGWETAACTDTNGQCNCSLSTTQQAGIGQIVSYTEPTGAYTTSGNTLTLDVLNYSYCSANNTLTLTPERSALSGTIVLTKDGGGSGGAAGAGGSAGTGGSAGAGTGGSAGATGGSAGMTSGGASGAGGAGAGGGAGTGGSAGATGGSSGSAGAPSTGDRPCDIYAANSQTCVAAHSTVRALFGAYTGNLYQVRRADGMMKDIPVKANGFADSAQQEAFCSGSTCTIWRVYDQSPNGNFIEAQTPTSSVMGNSGMTAANAAAESLNVSGNKVYSLFTRPSQAYWRDGSASGMPLGAAPQGVYMVTSGEHYNDGCCYNYGNSQLDRVYRAGPRMDSVYFGDCSIWGTGEGAGPWVMADMEDGILSGPGTGKNYTPNKSMPFPYVTAMEKNNGTTEYAIRGANATTGTLTTMYKGALPAGKSPMRKEGAIVLGSGGDCCYSNNNASEGTFYEGAIVSGYPSDATDAAIQANIVSAGYGK